MAKQRKTKRRTQQRNATPTVRVVRGKSHLPPETGWRLAFKLAQARGEQLQQHRQGGKRFVVVINGEPITDEVEAATLVRQLMVEETDKFRRTMKRAPVPKELRGAVAKRCRIPDDKRRDEYDPHDPWREPGRKWFADLLNPKQK